MNLSGMMKQAKDMQAKMAKLKEELASKTIEASSGGGAVRIVVNGHNELLKITIAPELLKEGEASMLEDLILTAVNQALAQSQELAAQEMTKITGGLIPPGLF